MFSISERCQGRIQTKTKGGVTGRPSANRGVWGHAPQDILKNKEFWVYSGGGGGAGLQTPKKTWIRPWLSFLLFSISYCYHF